VDDDDDELVDVEGDDELDESLLVSDFDELDESEDEVVDDDASPEPEAVFDEPDERLSFL